MLEWASPAVDRGVARGLPRTPGDIDGLTLWLEADYGVEHTGGRVSAWRDRTGRGNHAVQATGASQPLFTTDSAGRVTVQADDNARYLAIPKGSTDIEPGTAATVYSVWSSSATTAFWGVWGLWGSAAAGNVWAALANDAANGSANFYVSETGTNTSRTATAAGDPTTGAAVCMTWRWDGTNLRSAVTATTGGPTACAGTKAASGTTGSFTILRYYDATANPAGVSQIYALLIVKRHLARDSAEDVFIRDYLRRKWGAP